MDYMEMVLSIDGVESRIWQGSQDGLLVGYFDATGKTVDLPPVSETRLVTGLPVPTPLSKAIST